METCAALCYNGRSNTVRMDVCVMKIAITGRNFSSAEDTRAVDLLRAAGHEVIDHSTLDFGTGTPEAEVIRAVGDAAIIVAGLEPISRRVIETCPNVRLVSRRGIGYDGVDLDACKARGAAVLRTTGAVEGAVAEHVMAYILHFARRVAEQSASMHRGEWNRVMMPGAKNRTLGLVGFGGIGKEVAKRAVPFGMNVLYNCRHPKPEWNEQYGVQYRALDDLLAESDYVAVCVPLTDATRHMFGAAEFARMKPGSVFLNIARGQIADTQALKAALDSGHLGGAGVDAFDSEPCTDSPLITCENAVLTPHTAPFTSENFCEMNRRAAQNVLDFLDGTLDPKYRLV